MASDVTLSADAQRLVQLAARWQADRDLRGQSRRDLVQFGHDLHGRVGTAGMLDVFDEVVQARGYPAVAGISGAWTGIGGWHACLRQHVR